jgi:RNA polymerase sigma-70 factor (ECF subfamily)
LESPDHPPCNGNSPEDIDLVQRIGGGDAEAMNELLRRYWSGVVEYVARFTGNRDAAKDIAQEIFLRLWQGTLTWKRTGSLRSFLYGAARNTARNRGRRWREVRVTSFEGTDIPLEAHRSPTPTDALEERELQSLFLDAVAALPRRRQEIFNLARVHGLSHREIAETMGISPQTVANQMSAALADLRRALDHLLDE